MEVRGQTGDQPLSPHRGKRAPTLLIHLPQWLPQQVDQRPWQRPANLIVLLHMIALEIGGGISKHKNIQPIYGFGHQTSHRQRTQLLDSMF